MRALQSLDGGDRAFGADRSAPASVAELFRYRALVKNLVFKDLKLKYRDSVFGAIWSLLNPLLLILVYTLAFKYILRIPMENYAYFLLVGLLPWNFFSSSLIASTQAITGNSNLIRKVYFPRETLPIATVLFTFFQLLLALAVFLPALVLVSGIKLHWTALLFAPLLLLHLLFTLGVALILATSTVFFRDVSHLTEVAVILLFWMTPIIYPVSMAPSELQTFFKLSPLAAFAIAYQEVLFWGRVPEYLVVSVLVGATALALFSGHTLFRRYSPGFAEEV
jgi:ABC-type polysaccharide/polyol phosphate export permease